MSKLTSANERWTGNPPNPWVHPRGEGGLSHEGSACKFNWIQVQSRHAKRDEFDGIRGGSVNKGFPI